MKVVMVGNYEYWKKRRDEDRKAYKAHKMAVYETVIDRLEKRFPGIGKQVAVVDISTPVTSERYTANHHGWQPWPPKQNASKIMPKV